MILGQDRDQLLRRAVPQVTRRRLLRVAFAWRDITCALVAVEAVDGRVMLACRHGRSLVTGVVHSAAGLGLMPRQIHKYSLFVFICSLRVARAAACCLSIADLALRRANAR